MYIYMTVVLIYDLSKPAIFPAWEVILSEAYVYFTQTSNVDT